jgi:hypothetical protein
MLTPNEGKLLHINGSLMNLEPEVEYLACLWSSSSGQASWPIRFKLYAPEGSNTNEISKNALRIYPNPVAENILYLESNDIVNSIQIFDLSGKKVLNMHVEQKGIINIPVGNIESGLYILRVETEDGVKSMKFSKK